MHFVIHKPSDVLLIRKLHSLFQNPSAEVLQVLGKQCEEVMPYKVKDALCAFVSQVRLPRPASPKAPESLFHVSTEHGGPHTHTSPRRFQLGVWVCDATSWRELVRNTSEILYLEHQEVFIERAFTVTGPRRPYFSKYASKLNDPFPVGGIYVETNLSANNSVAFVNELAEAFGYERPVINPAM